MDYTGWVEHEVLAGTPQLTEIDGRLSTRGYDVRLNHLCWPGGGSLRLAPSSCWLDVMLSPRSVTRPLPGGVGAAWLGSGTAMLVPASMPVIIDWSASDIRSVTCLFDPAALLSPCDADAGAWSVDRTAGDRFRRQVQEIGALLADEMLHPDLASEIKVESLLTYLACQMRPARPARGSSAMQRQRLDRNQLRIIRDLARQTDGAAPSVALLSERLLLTAPALGQMFRNTTGMTLRAYLAGQRIERARRLLADPALLIKQVAASAGFHSTAAFVAAFRRSVGTTPQLYRAAGGCASDPGTGVDQDA